MIRMTRIVYVVSTLAILATGVLISANLRTPEPDLVVHEWGTFTSVAGEDGSAMDWDVLGGKDDLPRFVNDRGYRGFKWRLSGTVRMETPVLYFYSPRALNAHVRVAFPKGLITECYPEAEYQVDQKSGEDGPVYRLPANLNGVDTSMTTLTGGIEWKNISIEPGTTPDLPREDNPSRYYAARTTDAAPVAVGDQHEKFLFYRGVGRFRIPLSARVSRDGKVVLENCGTNEVPMAIRFENRKGRMGYRVGGAVFGSITLDSPSLGAELAPLSEELESALVAQGLYPKEAEAMIHTWQDSWFEEGSRVIYIVPSRTVDAVLPLKVDPVPSQTVRVFVGRVELITAETMRSVEGAIAANDSCIAEHYGRFLEPILARILLENPAARSQIEQFRTKLGSSPSSAACL